MERPGWSVVSHVQSPSFIPNIALTKCSAVHLGLGKEDKTHKTLLKNIQRKTQTKQQQQKRLENLSKGNEKEKMGKKVREGGCLGENGLHYSIGYQNVSPWSSWDHFESCEFKACNNIEILSTVFMVVNHIKFTVSTISKCPVKWCSAHSRLLIHCLQSFSSSKSDTLYPSKNSSPLFHLPASGTQLFHFCFYDFDSRTHLMQVE